MNNLAEARIIRPTFRKPNNQKLPVALYFTEIGTLEIWELSTSSGGEMRFALRASTHARFLTGYSFPGIDIKPGSKRVVPNVVQLNSLCFIFYSDLSWALMTFRSFSSSSLDLRVSKDIQVDPKHGVCLSVRSVM